MIQTSFQFEGPPNTHPLVTRKAVLTMLESIDKNRRVYYARVRAEVTIPPCATISDLLTERRRVYQLCSRVGKLLAPKVGSYVSQPINRALIKSVLVVGELSTGVGDPDFAQDMRRVCRQVFERSGYSMWETAP